MSRIMDYILFNLVILNLILTVSTVPSVDVQPSPVATVTEGAMLWLTCRYDLDGQTLGHLQWNNNDSSNVAAAIASSPPQCTTSSPEKYSIDCNLASNEVRLGIHNPVHGDIYSCTVYLLFFPLAGPVSTQVSFAVPVPYVTFTRPVSGKVTVTPGASQVYTCVTGSCRPPARIDWYIDDVNVTTQTGSVSSDGDKFVTTSSFTLTGAKGESPVTVQCRASNVDEMTPVQSGVKTFVVQYQEEISSNPNTASIALFIISSLMLATTVSLNACFIYRRKLRLMTGKDKNPEANSVNLPQSAVGQHDITTERSHHDYVNFEEREPQSSYEYIDGNAAAHVDEQVSTDDRQRYESLGTRTTADLYEDLRGPEIQTYDNTVIR